MLGREGWEGLRNFLFFFEFFKSISTKNKHNKLNGENETHKITTKKVGGFFSNLKQTKKYILRLILLINFIKQNLINYQE